MQPFGIAPLSIPNFEVVKANWMRHDASMECKKETNLKGCNCTYEPCSRKGVCCDCLRYHVRSRQLPACVFPADAERTYDRSFEHFARLVEQGRA